MGLIGLIHLFGGRGGLGGHVMVYSATVWSRGVGRLGVRGRSSPSLALQDLAGPGWGLGNCLPSVSLSYAAEIDRPTYLEKAFAGGYEGMCEVTGGM